MGGARPLRWSRSPLSRGREALRKSRASPKLSGGWRVQKRPPVREAHAHAPTRGGCPATVGGWAAHTPRPKDKCKALAPLNRCPYLAKLGGW